MATVSMATWAGDSFSSPSQASAVRRPYLISRTIDIADVVTKKGTALAAADVIEVLNIPAGVAVLNAWATKNTAMTGSSTDLTLDVGITGVDPDIYVDGWDFDAASVGAWGTPAGVQTPAFVISVADTIDILIATQTGTFTGGKITVSALCVDVDAVNRPGLAALQS